MGIPSFDDGPRYVRELEELLRFPTISSDGDHAGDMRAAAEWLARKLAWAGGRVVETEGHPVVLAEWLEAAGAPTILVYAHYDVQPPGDEGSWLSPPFQPAVRDGRIYARGATDDKGPLIVPLLVAEAFLQQRGALPLNVRFLIEGEEEIGSRSLPGFLRAHRDDLAADLVVSADGAMWRPSEPSIPIAAKGLVSLDLTVTGPSADLHSGRHGGAVQNPLHALSVVLASLHDPEGRVTVVGFYDEVQPLSPFERESLAQVPFDEDAYRRELGVPALHGEAGFTALERLWARPTLEVNGVWGGGRYTVIPRRAGARISCRLVPEQRPDAIVAAIETHVHEHLPPGVEVSMDVEPGAVTAYSIPPEHAGVLAALRALRDVYPDREPLLVRIGGTLPAATLFEDLLGVKTLFFSFSTADEGLHAPNEFFRLDRLHEGMRAWARLWLELGDIAQRDACVT
ncbi:MAG TPA: dipeptidase [Gaiellaceae bacterium]|nr:dipeptidase [Gaiellaceae bacterium]